MQRSLGTLTGVVHWDTENEKLMKRAAGEDVETESTDDPPRDLHRRELSYGGAWRGCGDWELVFETRDLIALIDGCML